jgi:2-polyprenylphenol hydroxylase and related flavodoxin oxidoreductases
LRTDINKIRVVVIDQIVQETPSVRTLFFNDNLCYGSKPGQFVMVWIPRAEELPMSLVLGHKKNIRPSPFENRDLALPNFITKVKAR